MKWKDLDPDPRLLATLDAAGDRPADGSSHDKRNWGSRFADACAVMFADVVREHATFSNFEIRPNADGTGRESLTGVGGGKKKRVDVIVSTLASGLQVAISLKAENLSADDRLGRNTLNRIYELQDEVRAIHEYQPRAFVVGVFLMPLQTATDKAQHSSFARCVAQLRARTGRTDYTSLGQINRLDWAVVGLYVPDGEQRGVVRYFDVHQAPPRVGRPKLETTLTIDDVVRHVSDHYERDLGDKIDYAEPEDD